MIKILSIFGTRPEAIKMAPVLKKLEKHRASFNSRVCVTAQHRHMLDQTLNLFDIHPDYDLNIMKPSQDLFEITCNVMQGLKEVLTIEKPDMVLVQGDTTTAMAATLAAYYSKVKVAHIEAGLRTNDNHAPFPEEGNRKVVGAIADLHFAPTEIAKINLLHEGIAESNIFVTGNTVIDALLSVIKTFENKPSIKETLDAEFSFLHPGRKIILVTGHRRENFGEGMKNICLALVEIARSNPNIDIVYPVHLNPNVQKPVDDIIKSSKLTNLFLLAPLDYLPFVYLMARCYLVITDSGGIQEEAPSLGKPVLVTREITERTEAVMAGTVTLVGTRKEKIVAETLKTLNDASLYKSISATHNPYGDGKAAARIVKCLAKRWNKT